MEGTSIFTEDERKDTRQGTAIDSSRPDTPTACLSNSEWRDVATEERR